MTTTDDAREPSPSRNSSVEVTHDEFCQIISEDAAPRQNQTKGFRFAKKLRNSSSSLIHRNINKSRRSQPSSVTPTRRNAGRSSGDSLCSDSATADSFDGMHSVASYTPSVSYTVASSDTVKASNKKQKFKSQGPSQESVQHHQPKKKKKAWSKIKRIMGAKKDDSGSAADTQPGSPHSTFSSAVSSTRSRSVTDPSSPLSTSSVPFRTRAGSEGISRDSRRMRREEQKLLDDVIRGRLDGVDVLSLGPARFSSLRHSSPSSPESHGKRPRTTPREMVTDMVWKSAGRDPAEMVLEGFLPGGDDRWVVRMETKPVDSLLGPSLSGESVPSLQQTDDDDSRSSNTHEDGYPSLPIHKLWTAMWGAEPPPSAHLSRTTSGEVILHPQDGEEDVLKLAAACNVPIDVDEDTFIVDNALHLQSVHDIAAGSLKRGRFNDALNVFHRILRGLEMKHQDEPHYLIGTTLHNIGVIHMWEGNFEKALPAFEGAVAVRMDTLPAGHRDIAVSLSREAMVLFALNRLEDAALSFDKALQMTKRNSTTRAKILNNLGVVHFQRHDFIEALQSFTLALEIQRSRLEGKVRRESVVHDASITLGNMGKLYLERRDYSMSLFVYEESLMLQTTVFRQDNDIVLASRGNLAYVRSRDGNTKKALQIYEGILRSQEFRFGTKSREVMETTGMMASVYRKQQDTAEALRLWRKVLEWQERNLPASHPAIRDTTETIHQIESDGSAAYSEEV